MIKNIIKGSLITAISGVTFLIELSHLLPKLAYTVGALFPALLLIISLCHLQIQVNRGPTRGCSHRNAWSKRFLEYLFCLQKTVRMFPPAELILQVSHPFNS